MHRTKLVLTFLALAALAWAPGGVLAQQADGIEQALMPERGATRAARLRTALDPTDPDTVWIGHIYDQSWTAGGTMPAGGYGPYRVGRGPNRPTKSGGTIGDNGVWDFDRFQAAEQDSLQGWWPVARAFQSGTETPSDYRRAFIGLDYGNQVNYVINQGSPKRTFGVTGLWHRDRGNAPITDSIPGANVQPVLWSASEVGGAGSTASAWMGMRSQGDLSHVDDPALGGTGNPFNASVLQYQGNNGLNQVGSVSVNGTDHNFPGYGSQMDQMLYRDVQLAEGDGLALTFNFSTNMSLLKVTSLPHVGWFDKDPISNAQIGVGSGATPSSDGNYISGTVAGANAPCDSFMVYVGAPVNDNDVTFSGPLFVGGSEITTVYDKRRRWFSEVLQLSGNCPSCAIIGKEIASYAGNHTPASVNCNFGALYPAALQAIKDADGQTGNGGTVRIVFRVKTNRGFDDENGGNPSATYDSGTRGAAIVDNVAVNGWAAANGDFEAANSINNDPAVPATAAWKSTGKPPAVYFHAHSVMPGGGLAFNDPCGSLDSPNRQCNLYGRIITSGDHDEAEKDGGLFGSNTQDRQRWFVSPTVNLVSTGNGPGFYNAMGIDDEIARTTGDYDCMFSLYNAGLVNATTSTGNFLSIGWQSYPARQPNGNICWGETRHTTSIYFYGTRGCFETTALGGGAKSQGLIRTTNPQNRPDSLRLYIHRISRCFSFLLTAATCSPTTGDNVGTYFDNISIALIDGATPPAISIPIWMLINDAFPANGNSALIPAGFDTCAAQVRIGLNIAANTGSTARPSITGDSVVVTAPGGNTRLDLVFRIKPGVGNYMTTGVRASGVKRRPDVTVAAAPGDGSFFGEYMADPGAFSKGTHTGGWSADTWNSARCDTAEQNLFPTANNGSVVGLQPGVWASTYHESDPKYATLGISKFICAMTVPGGATNSTNILCDGTNWGAYGAGSGWNGVTTTKEHTKILPDGLLTPGSHVEYFFRKSDVSNPAAYTMGPDTNFILQPSEGSLDGHRWQEFSVLPDRWKDGAWSAFDRDASAPACMLYIDWCDRRGDERTWVGIADSMCPYQAGLTWGSRYGAHNGWHARGDQDITQSLQTVIGTADDWGVYKHGGQPGTMWDMFGVKGAESSTITSSLGSRSTTPATGLQTGKDTKGGPTGDMLRQYYGFLIILTGDLNAGIMGPYADKGDNDIGLLQDFVSSVSGTAKPRGVLLQGRNWVEGQVLGGATAHPSFPQTFFGASLVSGDYRNYTGNTNDAVDLTPNPPTDVSGAIYGVRNDCLIANDVLSVSGTFGAAMAARYPVGGVNPNPKIASIYAPSTYPSSTDHEATTLVNGWRISDMGTQLTLQPFGRFQYFAQALANLFGSLSCPFCAIVDGAGDRPENPLRYYLELRSANPLIDAPARMRFGIVRAEKVELRLYDAAGRQVRLLANRAFTAGDHDIYWDGRDDEGRVVPRGIYFYQIRTPSFTSQKKIAVLRR